MIDLSDSFSAMIHFRNLLGALALEQGGSLHVSNSSIVEFSRMQITIEETPNRTGWQIRVVPK